LNKPWRKSKDWADKYFPDICAIIQELAGEIIDIKKADINDDIYRATDFVVRAKTGNIAGRIRKLKYFEEFGDFTLRYSRPSGVKTELQKIREGFANWYLYSWADPKMIQAWIFVDLECLRKSGILDNPQKLPKSRNPSDGTTFVSISIDDLDKNGCIKRKKGNFKTRLDSAREEDEADG